VKFGVVIAIAGLSGRMGAFKPLLPPGNTPLIEEAFAEYTNINFIYNKDFAVTDMFYFSICQV
jgi:CTP:molybdopterin cytidylyltransferase MocA